MRTSKGVDIPVDLAGAFQQKPQAWEGFEAMRPASQKDFVVSIENANGPASRRQRIERTIRESERHFEILPRPRVPLP